MYCTGQGAFSQCAALESVNIPDTVKKIGQGAFYYCMALESLELPDSVESLGEYVFSNCYALKTVKLPTGLKSLPAYAFYYDIGLSEITLPDGMEKVSEMSFVNCMSMEKLSLPASMSEIGDFSMLSCMGLKTIEVDPNNRVYRTNGEGWLITKDGTMLVMYPAGRDETVAAVPNGITEIKPYAFSVLNIPAEFRSYFYLISHRRQRFSYKLLITADGIDLRCIKECLSHFYSTTKKTDTFILIRKRRIALG